MFLKIVKKQKKQTNTQKEKKEKQTNKQKNKQTNI